MTLPIIDPGVVTLIQSAFLNQIEAAFTLTAGYAIKLLYLFATIELTVLGLVWALQRDAAWERLFFKIIRIGLIFFIIQNYGWLLDTILSSFARLAGGVIDNAEIAQYVFNPAKLWQYGYNIGVHLLQVAANSNIFGLTLIMVSLGIGILLVFGLLGIQMVIQVVGFYVVSFGSLVLLPFGALTSARNMFDKAVQAVLKAGLRLTVLIIIIGIAVATWSGFELTDLATTDNFNLNQVLGLFFSALLFLCLAIYLPRVVSEAVGGLNSDILEGGQTVVVTSSAPAVAISSGEGTGGGGGMSDIRAATTIDAHAPSSGSMYEGGGVASAATMPTSVGGFSAGGGIDSRSTGDVMGQASKLSQSISDATVKKIKETVLQAVKEKGEKK